MARLRPRIINGFWWHARHLSRLQISPMSSVGLTLCLNQKNRERLWRWEDCHWVELSPGISGDRRHNLEVMSIVPRWALVCLWEQKISRRQHIIDCWQWEKWEEIIWWICKVTSFFIEVLIFLSLFYLIPSIKQTKSSQINKVQNFIDKTKNHTPISA